MTYRISASVGAYEAGSVNKKPDVTTIQTMLTAVSRKYGAMFDPKGIDGLIARTASRSSTVTAITNFQAQKVGLRPDKRIDVNGKTWKKLISLAGAGAAPGPAPTPNRPATGLVTMTVRHGGKIPTKTNGSTATTNSLYESTVSLAGGGMSGTFRCSIYPDDMNVKGRLVDGSYPLHIGFHKGGKAARQSASELVVKTQKIRAGLLVNARNSVPVQSNNASKRTSVGVNVHNGFHSQRFSDGCITIMPTDWARFIQKFLDGYPDINDWHKIGNNTGKKIGSLVIRS